VNVTCARAPPRRPCRGGDGRSRRDGAPPRTRAPSLAAAVAASGGRVPFASVIPIRDKNPTVRFPVVTVALLVVNVAVWLFYQVPDLATSVVESGYFPCEPDNSCPPGGPPGPPWPVDAVTSMFMHGSWIHIAGNMLFLWIFGNNVEDRLGRIGFTGFYLASGFAATALQSFVTLHFGTPEDAVIPNVGASGAIAGVLGAYIVLFPSAQVQTLIFLWWFVRVAVLPASLLLGWWFLLQIISGFIGLGGFAAQGGVAYFAHIGGFAAGWLLVRVFAAGRPALNPYDDLRIPRVDDLYRPPRRRNDRWWD
jgi:hypothetical protein